jgi:hypothetical protein
MFIGRGDLAKELQRYRKIEAALTEILDLPQNLICYCTPDPEVDTCVICRARDYVKEI